MKWDREVRAQAAAHLSGHGLNGCPVCGSETLDVHGPLDKDTQVDFMVRIECRRCGYNMLFDSARFYGGDVPAFEAERVADDSVDVAITAEGQQSRPIVAAGTVVRATTPL
jgi:hypothetical protein